MEFHNLLQSNMMQFALRAKETGWTEEETRAVVEAVQKEINDNIRRGNRCNIDSILRRHAMPIVEAKRREQEQQNKKL